MELFGAKFCIALGAWKLRFVLMLEDEDAPEAVRPAQRVPHHVHAHPPGAHVR
ncbi:MAG TPA: hypothetical protein VIO32_08450 [Candidatus Baltobacteraceae bacterium]